MNAEQAISVLGMIETHGSLALQAKQKAIEALGKQVVKPLEAKAHPDYRCIGKMYYCQCGVAYFDVSSNFCGNCGQKLRKE